MSNSTNLFSLARDKLHVSIGGKDKCSLHRWVLLKNSIVNSPVTPTHSATFDSCSPTFAYQHPEDEHDEEITSDDTDSFMFPDAGKFADPNTDVPGSESQWLDSLLETLGDEDEDDYSVESEAQSSILMPTDEEDDDSLFFSPTSSPMSSSDDLPNQPSFYPSVSYAYSYPYPMHPPLLLPFDSSSISDPYHEPLPYSDLSDSETLSVPDAIEDTSDDESDAPLTPCIGRSGSSLALFEASIPLPTDRSHLRQVYPVVRVDAEDSYFYPFELDPLPFPSSEDSPAYNTYQEC